MHVSNEVGWRCSCANQSQCHPLATPAAVHEVFAYFEDRNIDADFMSLFTDGVVTTIGVCERHAADTNDTNARMRDEHLCYAHSRGVRVVPGCVGCDVWSSDLSTCVGHTSSIAYDFNNGTVADTLFVCFVAFCQIKKVTNVNFSPGTVLEQLEIAIGWQYVTLQLYNLSCNSIVPHVQPLSEISPA